MPFPIELRTIQHLQATLRAIAAGSGYHNTVLSIAVKLDPNASIETFENPDGVRPMVTIQLGRELWEYAPSMQLKLRQPVTVHWVQDYEPTDDAALMDLFFKAAADVEAAIAVDVSRGGVAADTRVTGRTMTFEGTQMWAQFELVMIIHRTYGQPNG